MIRSTLSPDAVQAVQALQGPIPRWGLSRRRKRFIEAIDSLVCSGEALAAPALFDCTYKYPGDIAKAAALAIERLLSKVRPEDLAYLSQRVRDASPYGTWAWMEIRADASAIRNARSFGHAGVFVVGLSSFSRSGYVREAAIQELAQYGHGAGIPFLLLRIDDWVPQVREAARKAIAPYLTQEHAQAVIQGLPLIERFRISLREGTIDWIQGVEELLGSEAFETDLKIGLDSPSMITRRACIAIAADHKRLALCRHGLANTDVVVRRRSAQFLLDTLPLQERVGVVEQLFQDRNPGIRQMALRVAAELPTPNQRDMLEHGLLDRSFRVREVACYHMWKLFRVDLGEFYRSRLCMGSAHGKAATVLGLARHGDRDDVQAILPLTSSDSPRLARSALEAVGRLDPEGQALWLNESLAHGTPAMARAARDFLKRCPNLVDHTILEPLLTTSPHAHVRAYTLGVLQRSSKWPSLRYALIAFNTSDPQLQRHAVRAMHGWIQSFNRQLTPPTAFEEDEIRDLFAIARSGLSQAGLSNLQCYIPD